MRLFFAGYRYISKHVASLFSNEVLLGSVHSATQESDSVQLCHFDSINEATLEGVTHIVISIPSLEVAKFITKKHGLKMPPVIGWETLPENDPMKHYF